MTRFTKLASVLALAAGLFGAAHAGAWDRKNQGKNLFILRGPAAEIHQIAERNGLTVHHLLAAGDPDQELAVVEGSPSLTPEQAAELVAPDDQVLGFEPIELAALPETVLDQSTASFLEQSTASFLETAATPGVFSDGALENFFEGTLWNGYAAQPAVYTLRLAEARELAPSGAAYGSGVVAVIDNGIDPNHPLLANALVPGYDFVSDEPGIPSEWSNLDQSTASFLEQSTASFLEQAVAALVDGEGGVWTLEQSTTWFLEQSTASFLEDYELPPTFGHGTMVAGLIRLVAPGARIMPLRAFDGSGSANMYDIVRAIHFAVDNGAHVINMSFSTETYSAELARAINYAHRNGVVCVSAAGNRAERTMTYPAALGFSVGVASTSLEDTLSVFSNFGSDLVSLSAPGERLVSTFPGGSFAAASGTSFSTPLVSGAIALLHNSVGNGRIKTASDFFKALFSLSEGAEFIPSLSSEIGMGRLDVAASVAANPLN